MNQDTFSEIAGMREELARLRIQVAEAEEAAHVHSKAGDELAATNTRLRAENEDLTSQVIELRSQLGTMIEESHGMAARIRQLEAWEPAEEGS